MFFAPVLRRLWKIVCILRPASRSILYIQCSLFFPIGLWIFSFVSDLIAFFGADMHWNDVAFYTMLGGLIGAVAAAVPGLIDMLSLTDARVRKIARNHMLLNLSASILFAINLYLRTVFEPGAVIPVWLSALGVLLLGLSGWLGGELAYVHGVGVEPAERDRTEKRLRRAL
jgi:uncharacterized membrane protein